mgnify:CR=1 FL=1
MQTNDEESLVSKENLRYLEHHNSYSDSKLRRILRDVKTFAMVGASSVWRRPSYYAMTYLQHKGFRIIPINPARAGETVLGEKVYGSLSDVPYQLDMVDIFRTSLEAYKITKDVIANKDKLGLKYLWMQLTVRNDMAAELAEKAGLEVVMDRCPKIEFGRLSGELSWLGVNSNIISAKTLKSPKAN